MIEKKIHYVWFGKQKPKKVLECIESWKKKLPDYEIIEWNEESFNIEREQKNNKFLRECYKRKLWAFVADYIRVKVLYEYGGIYLDTDMEILKDISPLLDCNMFLGYENSKKDTVNLAIIGVVKKHFILKKMLEFYEKDIWKSPSYIITSILGEVLFDKDILENLEEERIKIYSREYFYPFNHDEEFKETCIQQNTYAIHWWDKSWKKNPKVYFLKYKHFPWWKKYPKHFFKLLNYYFKNLLSNIKEK